MCAACYICGVPQYICNKWKAKSEGSRKFKMCKSIPCQFFDVVIPVVVVISRAWDSPQRKIIYDWMKEDSVDGTNEDDIYKWLGQKIIWGGMEASKLSKVFHKLVKMVEDGEKAT